MADNQRPTTKPVYLAPPVVGVISNADKTTTSCGPFSITAQFAELSEGCNESPDYLFLEIYRVIREETEYTEGYGYGDFKRIEDSERIVVTETSPGSQEYEGELEVREELEVTGQVEESLYYDTPGAQTIQLPTGPGQAIIEVWGGGGNPLLTSCYLWSNIATAGGGGGYSRKVIDLDSLAPTDLDIIVGGTGQASTVAYTGDTPFMGATAGGNGSINFLCQATGGAGGVGFGGDTNESGEVGESQFPAYFWDVSGGAAGGQPDGGDRSNTTGEPPGGGGGSHQYSWGTGATGVGAPGAIRITVVRDIVVDGYGYGYDGYGYGYEGFTVGYGYGETTSTYQNVLKVRLVWEDGAWYIEGLIPGVRVLLSNGDPNNPQLACGEETYYDPVTAKTYYVEACVLNVIPTDGYGSGETHFECGNYAVGAEDPTPYSLVYTDQTITEAEFEIIGPAGIEYRVGGPRGDGRFVLKWSPDQNGEFTIRARGISEHDFYTRFGNTVKYTVTVSPPEIDFYIIDEQIQCLPLYGSTVIVTEQDHTFQYVLDSNCFGTKQVEYSLDSEDWRSTDYTTGLLTVERLVPGVHTLQIRALDEAGQYSTISELTFFVTLSTFVTIDDYPVDPLCRPDSTAVVGGSREANTRVVSIRGVHTDTLRFPSPTTWEADIDLIGNEEQIVEIEVESIFGHTATATQSLFYKARLPKVILSAIKPVTFISKVILRGTKDADTSIQVSHNNGTWTTIVLTNAETSWQYILELVSGQNVISVRAVDSICGFVGEEQTVETIYADSNFVSGAFQINNGAPLTGTTDVLLTFNSTTATRMRVSNFEDFREGFVTDYTENLSWTLLDFPGLKRVYVRFLDDSELESIVFFDEILLTASNQLTEIKTEDHQAHSLNAIDTITGNPLGTVLVIRDKRNGIYVVEVYQTPTAALEGIAPIALATTVDEGLQTLILYDTGTGIVNVEGTVEVTIVRGSEDVYVDRRKDVWDVKTGESIIPLEYDIAEDAKYFYALLSLPYYESRFQGRVQDVLAVNQETQTTTLAIDKVFLLLTVGAAGDDSYGYGYGYGYGYEKAFAQALANVPTPLKEQFATYPLSGMRFWYPTLEEYSMITEIEETEDSFILTIDQALTNFENGLAARIEFTRQNKNYIDYRVDKSSGIVEFINESTYATGNAQFEYEYARRNQGRPDENWYQLCGLRFNDHVMITIPQTENRVTLSQLKQLCVRFYNGDEGTAPKIVRFIINDSIVYEDRTSDVIEGPEGYGYSYGYTGYGYRLTPGSGDQVVKFCVDNVVDEEIVVDKIQIEFRATTPCMYIGEVVVNSETVPLDTNLQVVVNDEVVLTSLEPVTNQFDRYEIRFEKGEADIWYNNKFMYNVDISDWNLSTITRQFGAGARTANDKVDGSFQQVIDKKYYDDPVISINLIGRFIGIEPNLRDENDDT